MYNGVILTYKTNPYATHQPVLIYALENTSGDILELGVGDSSTLLLHNSIKNTNRKLISIDDNEQWISKYLNLQNENHNFFCIDPTVEEWESKINELSRSRFSVTFVDHANLQHIWKVSRPYAVEKMVDCSDFVVVHDADLFPEMKNNQYNIYEYVPSVKPMRERNGPSTYIISKKHNLHNIVIKEYE